MEKEKKFLSQLFQNREKLNKYIQVYGRTVH